MRLHRSLILVAAVVSACLPAFGARISRQDQLVRKVFPLVYQMETRGELAALIADDTSFRQNRCRNLFGIVYNRSIRR